mgnify:FL=1
MLCPEVISSQLPLQTEIIYVLCLIKCQSFPLDADIILILLIIERWSVFKFGIGVYSGDSV